MNAITINSPFGWLTLYDDGGAITEVRFGRHSADGDVNADELLSTAAAQLCEYFDGRRKGFDLPLKPRGTAFQRSVWAALLDIPFGETRSYAEIAAAIGNPNACRAVGNANGKNPIPIIIPCHRVIAADGKIGGYSAGLEIKQRLLALEGRRRCL